jgi:hypothetical protein
LIYGGLGYWSAGGYGPQCRFIYPGFSDTLNWGTSCIPPNGPKEWTEITAGNNPHDVRGVASGGPFTFNPGDKEELDFAYIFARDMNGDSLQSLEKLRKAIDHINYCFQRDSICGNKKFSSVDKKKASSGILRLYPNPASSNVTLEFADEIEDNVVITFFNLYGREVISAEKRPGVNQVPIDVSGFTPGLYIILARTKDFNVMKKLSVIQY